MTEILTEADFHARADTLWQAVEAALDLTDCDFDQQGNVFTIECPNTSQLILSRHVPNREIWLAAKQGGFHFQWRDSTWADTRGEWSFWPCLQHCLAAQGIHLDVPV